MPFSIVKGDITRIHADAIVNAANTSLKMGGGVCGAIFRAAGQKELQAACRKVAPIRTGEAAITDAFGLNAKYIIHAAGPRYGWWNKNERRKRLLSAYREALKLAREYACESIAFPLISSGTYRYPAEEALEVATEAIESFLDEYDMDVILVIYNKAEFVIRDQLQRDIADYIKKKEQQRSLCAARAALDDRCLRDVAMYADFLPAKKLCFKDIAPEKEADDFEPEAGFEAFEKCCEGALESEAIVSELLFEIKKADSLSDALRGMDEPFSSALMKLIDKKGKTDVEIYKKANIDRKLFSKIRSTKGYTPRKPTILALAIALELTLEETDKLLERAGYALSHASKFDVIVEYFIIKKQYNIFEINEALFAYDQPLLGC